MPDRISAGALGGGRSLKDLRRGTPQHLAGYRIQCNANLIPAQTRVTVAQQARRWPLPEMARKLCTSTMLMAAIKTFAHVQLCPVWCHYGGNLDAGYLKNLFTMTETCCTGSGL